MNHNEHDNPNQEEPVLARHVEAGKFEPAVITPTAFTPSQGDSSKSWSIKPWTVAIGTLLLGGLLVVWFLFSAKSVVIHTQPATSKLEVSGGLLFELSGHYLMLKGQYRLTAELDGHYPIDQTITIDDRQNQQQTVQFEKLPGSLTVDVGSNIVADIYIDGQLKGQSGKKLADIKAGGRQLKVTAPRYFDHNQAIDIVGKAQHQSLSINLKPAWANVTLASEPGGATLKSDSEPVGTTPFDGTLLQGKQQLTLTLPGYKPWSQEVMVVAGKALDLGRVYLEKADGILQLSSTPEGASVTANGQYFGLTPLTLNLPPNTSHRLSLFKDGYEQFEQVVTLKSGIEKSLSLTLKAKLGQVTVNADQSDALLYVDGTLLGRASQTLTLTTKQHQITVKKDGFVDYQTTVLPRADLQQIVDIRMKTLAQAKWESYDEVVTTALGGKLKLFKPKDVFTMGASRREQGRRANEVNRRISLKRPFYLATTEVTNAEFKKFVRHHSSGHVEGNSLNGSNQPVVQVSWMQAAKFCNWLSQKDKLPPFYQFDGDELVGFDIDATGYRLPTEAEWAWASRYQNGQMLKYSWGSMLPPKPNSGNFADRSGAAILGFIQASYDDKYTVTSPVASFAPNDKGIFDLDGNVAEWIHDFYEVKTGLASKLERDPIGPEKGDYHVIRGASWAHGTMTELRLSFRDYGVDPRNDVGFRLARFVDSKEVLND